MMRILLIFKEASWIETHIIPSFLKLDAKIELFNMRHAFRGTPEHQELRSKILDKEGYDLIFIVEGDDSRLDADCLRACRKAGTKIVNYLVDVPQDWWRSIEVCEECDFVLVAQTTNSERLKCEGNQVDYFPFAVSDDFLATSISVADKTWKTVTSKDRCLFVGSAHSRWRWKFLRDLDKAGIVLDVIGPGWTGGSREVPNKSGTMSRYSARHHVERILGSGPSPIVGGLINALLPVPSQKLFKNISVRGFLPMEDVQREICSASCIVSTSVHGSGYLVGATKRQVKLRDIEMACMGTPYITDMTSELLGEGYPFLYKNINELRDVIEKIRNDVDKCRISACTIQAKIQKSDTWSTRMRQVSDLTGLQLDEKRNLKPNA